MSVSPRAVILLALVSGAGAIGAAAACASCDGDGSAIDGGDGALADSARDVVDAAADQADACPTVVSDWLGYVRYTAMSSCARLDVPIDASVLPPIQWVACKSGRANCVELAVTWAGTGTGQFFGTVRVGKDGQHNPSKLLIDIAPGVAEEETCIYDFATAAPITSWRFAGNLTSDVPSWPRASGASAALFGIFSNNTVMLGTGTVTSLLAGQGLNAVPTSIIPSSSAIQFDDISDTTYAFDTGTTGRVNRVAIGTTNYVIGSVKGVALSKPIVHADDVFAYANQGTDGWARYYRVDANGTVADFINNSQHFMSGLAADAQRIYWIDAYGASQPGGAQPNTELWSAPYTADLPTVASTGSKVAVISGTRGNGIAFSGYWAGLLGVNDIWVARASDGKTWHVTPEANRRFNSLAYVDDKEVWVVEDLVPDSGAFTLGVAFERIAYGP